MRVVVLVSGLVLGFWLGLFEKILRWERVTDYIAIW